MTSDASNVPPAGLVAGKYQLLRLIGRGGMGSVWEGRHVSLGTKVAVKFIEAEYANSQDARARFDNEARAAATIESKHAIQIYDHGLTEDGRPYIVMEMLIGETLDERLKRLTHLPLPDLARILQHVCRGLQRAHASGIIHRDLKPENIFLVRNPDDDDEIAKVLDFGIAKIRTTPGAVGVSSSTKTGTLLGTPFYMSPEQARGLRNVDHRSDLWSLGVIVFRAATGVLPFDGESLGDLLVKICTVAVPVPSHVLPGLPPSFDAWAARALDRDPDRRFQTAQELSEALAYASGVSVRRGGASGAHTPTPHLIGGQGPGTSTPHSMNQSHRQAMTPSGHHAGLHAGFGAPSASYAQPIPAATSAPFTSTPQIPGTSKGLLFSVAGGALVAAGIGAFLVLRIFAGPRGEARPDPGPTVAASPPTPTPAVSVAPPTPAVAAVDAGETPTIALSTLVPAPTPHGKPPRSPHAPHPEPPSPRVVTVPAANPPAPAPPPPAPPPPKSTPAPGDPGY
jgi:serine/threonine protein kinase